MPVLIHSSGVHHLLHLLEIGFELAQPLVDIRGYEASRVSVLAKERSFLW